MTPGTPSSNLVLGLLYSCSLHTSLHPTLPAYMPSTASCLSSGLLLTSLPSKASYLSSGLLPTSLPLATSSLSSDLLEDT